MKKVLTVTIDGIRYHASRPADCRIKSKLNGLSPVQYRI